MCTKWFKIKIESFIEILNEEEKACFFTFLDFMPSYILEKNDKNILSEEDGNLFYEVFLPFLEYAAEFYDLEFDHYEKSYNPQHAYLIFEKCSENKFRVVDNFINDTRNISSEHKQILNGLKRAKKGAFIIYKHTKDGSIFIDEKSLYLVKGVQSNLENMEYIKETPCACMTILIPFKKQITYCGILTPMGTLGPNLKKQYNEFYKKNKNKLLKTL